MFDHMKLGRLVFQLLARLLEKALRRRVIPLREANADKNAS
jgi:hypothetical protein